MLHALWLPEITIRQRQVSRVIVSPVEEVEVRMSALLIVGSIRKQSRVNDKNMKDLSHQTSLR